jgi:hypothetical protein
MHGFYRNEREMDGKSTENQRKSTEISSFPSKTRNQRDAKKSNSFRIKQEEGKAVISSLCACRTIERHNKKLQKPNEVSIK